MNVLQINDIIEIRSPKHQEYRQVQIKHIPYQPNQLWVFQDVLDGSRWSIPVQGSMTISSCQ